MENASVGSGHPHLICPNSECVWPGSPHSPVGPRGGGELVTELGVGNGRAQALPQCLLSESSSPWMVSEQMPDQTSHRVCETVQQVKALVAQAWQLKDDLWVDRNPPIDL